MTSLTRPHPEPSATTGPRGSGEAEMLALLTGPRAGEPLSLAVATLRVELRDHEVHSVQHRPGAGVTVGYRVWLLHDSGELVEDYVLLSSTAGRDVPDDAPNVVSVNGPSGRLLGWRHPHDPALPGLGTACDPRALEGVLPGTGPVTSIELVGYRPLRRAVVRAVRDGVTSYVKVLRPAAGRGGAPDVVRRLSLLAGAGLQVPNLLAARDDGLLVLSQALGTPFVEAIGADAAHGVELPDLVDLLDVDTVGPGHRVDDLACLVAHAIALGPAGQSVAERWERQARVVVDPEALAVRTAGVLLSLAAGAVHESAVAMPTASLLDAAEERLTP